MQLIMGFIVRMACIRVNKQVGLVKHVTLHVRLVFPLLRGILVHLGVVIALVVLMDVFNVKETYFMLRMVLLKGPAYPKPNALKTISKSTEKSVLNQINVLTITTWVIIIEDVTRNHVVVVMKSPYFPKIDVSLMICALKTIR